MDSAIKFTKERLVDEIENILSTAPITKISDTVPASYPVGILYNNVDLDKMDARIGVNEEGTSIFIMLDSGYSKYDVDEFRKINSKLFEFGFKEVGFTGTYESNGFYVDLTEQLFFKYYNTPVTILYKRLNSQFQENYL